MNKTFHHIGIPTTEKHPAEVYLEDVKLHITDANASEHHVEWVRCEPGSPMAKLVQERAHVAYTVDNLDQALVGKKVIMKPFAPMDGLRVAFIDDDGAPVEYLEFKK